MSLTKGLSLQMLFSTMAHCLFGRRTAYLYGAAYTVKVYFVKFGSPS